MPVSILPNIHTSPEMAYVVQDYPYGFRLRCQIRYWIDVHPTRGCRLMSQTSNPKMSGLVWNKPKASIYSLFGMAMYIDESGHVQQAGLTEYTNGAEATAFRDTYGAGVPNAAKPTMDHWIAAKVAYDAKRAAGASMISAAVTGTIAGNSV